MQLNKRKYFIRGKSGVKKFKLVLSVKMSFTYMLKKKHDECLVLRYSQSFMYHHIRLAILHLTYSIFNALLLRRS